MLRSVLFFTAALAVALLFHGTGQFAEAQEKSGGSSSAGGEAASRNTDKNADNAETLWSADPQRGWLRAGGQRGSKKQPSKSDKKQAEAAKKGKNLQDPGVMNN